MANRSTFLFPLLLSLSSVCSVCLVEDVIAAEAESDDEEFLDLTDEQIKAGMDIIKAAITGPLPKNNFFQSVDDLHDLLDEGIDIADDEAIATPALAEILNALQEASSINATNYPYDIISGMRETINDIYLYNQANLYYYIEKDPKSLEKEAILFAWQGLADLDFYTSGAFLLAFKGLQLNKSKTTFKKDFETLFPHFSTLYAISNTLEDAINTMSSSLEEARTFYDKANQLFKYDEIYNLLLQGKMDEVIKRTAQNIENGDAFISLALLGSLVGFGVDGAMKKMEELSIRLKSTHPDVIDSINDYMTAYQNLKGYSSCTMPSPKQLAQLIQVPPKPSLRPTARKPQKENTKVPVIVPVKVPEKSEKKVIPVKVPEPKKKQVVPAKTPEPKKKQVVPVKAPEQDKKKAVPVEKSPPEIPGYTLGKYADGKWWYFRFGQPVKRAPQ